MASKSRLAMIVALSAGLSVSAVNVMAQQPAAAAPAPAAAAPADGITMDMMPITAEQLKTCRDQATQQLAAEQDTLHQREHGQDNDKMKQGAVTGATGVATSAVSRKNYGWWGYGNNNGAQTAAATGATQRTDRNSQAVASTTDTSQLVGTDAYKQCIAGIKGPEYVHFRQTGQMTSMDAASSAVHSVNAPATPAPATASTAAPLAGSGPTIQDEGDGKHAILVTPGQTDGKELTLVPGSKNSYIDDATGDKYIVMPNGSITRIPHKTAATKVAAKS
jgi:hypothetical protein